MRKRLYIMLISLFSLFLFASAIIAADAASVKITKCEYKEGTPYCSKYIVVDFVTKCESYEVGGDVLIEYAFVKGPKGDHVHLWIDGKEKKPVKQPKGYKLIGANLSKGEHKIELRVNNASHTEIGVNDSYKLIVK